MMTRAKHQPHFQVGANPIIWSNDDFHDLGGDIPLEQCLSEMQLAGYAGSELGHKYPRDPEVLRPLLERHALQLVSGWHSLELLTASWETEKQRFREHMQFLKHAGSNVVIMAECSHRVYNDPQAPLQFDDREQLMNTMQWDRLALGLEALAEMALEHDMRPVYHHHMGTLIQSEAEVDELMARTQHLQLLVDTGHLAFAGAGPLDVLKRHAPRVGHIHLKDVRDDVVRRTRATRASFASAVRKGVFTVPGDGSIDYAPIFALLCDLGYDGWLVVEAEQDPRLSPPFKYARMGRTFIRHHLGV